MAECNSFKPNINKHSKILILGSMPGIKSLEMKQYYAHPQNRFWMVMSKLCKCENLYNLEYSQRIKILLNNNYALWDVVGFCNREGSLDSAIRNEIPNKIPELLGEYKNIQKIYLNGNKAYTALKKYFPEIIRDYQCYKMPSTSPANAKFRLNDLYNAWNI